MSRRPVTPVRLIALVGVVAVMTMTGGCAGKHAHGSHTQPPGAGRGQRSGAVHRQPTGAGRQVAVKAGAPRQRVRQPRSEALVTAETENRLLVVDPRTGRQGRSIAMPPGPQYVAAEWGAAVVTSPGAGAVTLLEGEPLRVTKVLRGFGAPHIAKFAPDGEHVFVTDDARGTLSVIRLADARVISSIHVGLGAHHLTSSSDQRRLWIELGESAHTIVIVDTSDIAHPRVIGRFHVRSAAHDLAFNPEGGQVWITSSSAPYVAVFDADDHRVLFHVPAGRPPQHIAFDGAYVYVTSGYGASVEKVSVATGRVVRRAGAPYGSFELSVADGFVATSSLLDGKVAIYTPQLKLLHVLTLAPETRDVAISGPTPAP
jgi:DNA-binding beta-propeller fold protein YncE